MVVSQQNESSQSESFTIHRLEFDVDWPPGHVAAYLIDGKEPILLDAGMTSETAEQQLRTQLDEFGYEPADIDHLLLTHSHTDHVGQVRTILDAGDPTVYAPADVRERFARELETIRDATRQNLAEAGVEGSYQSAFVERLLDAHERNREALSTEVVDHWIEDHETLTIGGLPVESIATPGHHCTHLCYATTIADRRVLLAGDMAVEPFRSAAMNVNFDDGVRDGVDAFFATLDRLGDRSFDRVYPGHGPVHDNFDAAVENSKTDLQERVDRCATVVEEGEDMTAADVAAAQAEDLRERGRILAEVVGSLARLERQGEVDSQIVSGVRYYNYLSSQDPA